jgi:predicted RND superfamily exporter protein
MSVLSFDCDGMNILASLYICVFGVLLVFCFMVLCIIKFVVPHFTVISFMLFCAD